MGKFNTAAPAWSLGVTASCMTARAVTCTAVKQKHTLGLMKSVQKVEVEHSCYRIHRDCALNVLAYGGFALYFIL